jgi:hypothetical protein
MKASYQNQRQDLTAHCDLPIDTKMDHMQGDQMGL